MDIAKVVANVRLWYHANMTSVVNALNQLHLMSDEKAEEVNRKHCKTIFDDIFPRLGYDIREMPDEMAEDVKRRSLKDE